MTIINEIFTLLNLINFTKQDLLIFRLENDSYNLEDKINLYKTQWAIKKEEVADLRKELNAAHTEMEVKSLPL